jgi:uncharacterized membrane protein
MIPRIRRYLLAGLLLLTPFWVTLLVLKFLIDLFDHTLLLLPHAYHPEVLLGFHIPGLGLLFALVFVFLTGMIVTHLLGTRLLALWDSLVSRIPLVRAIYNSVKQILETILSSSQDGFRQVLLVEYPRKGSLAFQTSTGFDQANEVTGEELVSVFIPTTPNPTSGFLLFVPKKDTIKLSISVDQALKMVISLGVVMPSSKATLKEEGVQYA